MKIIENLMKMIVLYSEFRTKSFALITEGEMLLEGPKGLDKKVIGLLSDMIFTLYKYEKVSK